MWRNHVCGEDTAQALHKIGLGLWLTRRYLGTTGDRAGKSLPLMNFSWITWRDKVRLEMW